MFVVGYCSILFYEVIALVNRFEDMFKTNVKTVTVKVTLLRNIINTRR